MKANAIDVLCVIYRLEFSWHRFTASNRHFIDEIFYQAIPNHIGAGVVLFTAWGLCSHTLFCGAIVCFN